MNNRLPRLVKDDSGATAIEYGLIAGLIAVAIVSTLVLLGPKLRGAFQAIEAVLPAAT
jgi:pilus assembly protein Flp/PilA